MVDLVAGMVIGGLIGLLISILLGLPRTKYVQLPEPVKPVDRSARQKPSLHLVLPPEEGQRLIERHLNFTRHEPETDRTRQNRSRVAKVLDQDATGADGE